MDPKTISFMQMLADALFEPIEPNKKFINDRVDEWMEGLQKPALSEVGSPDRDALEKIHDLHRELTYLDARNTSWGPIWKSGHRREFEDVCENLAEAIDTGNVDSSIKSILLMHRSVLARSGKNYDFAIRLIEESSDIYERYIQDNDGRWPGYSRDLILNQGWLSDFNRRAGRFKEAIHCAEAMHEQASAYLNDNECRNYDGQIGECSIYAWALYYLCEAHISVPAEHLPEYEETSSSVFSETFTRPYHYKKWPQPTLIQILRNTTWQQQYDHYFDEIANIAYKKGAGNVWSRLLRVVSVLFGRVQIKASAAAVAGVALFAFCVSVFGSMDLAAASEVTPNIIDQLKTYVQEAISSLNSALRDAEKLSHAELNDVKMSIEDALTPEAYGQTLTELAQQLIDRTAGDLSETDFSVAGNNQYERSIGPKGATLLMA